MKIKLTIIFLCLCFVLSTNASAYVHYDGILRSNVRDKVETQSSFDCYYNYNAMKKEYLLKCEVGWPNPLLVAAIQDKRTNNKIYNKKNNVIGSYEEEKIDGGMVYLFKEGSSLVVKIKSTKEKDIFYDAGGNEISKEKFRELWEIYTNSITDLILRGIDM